MTIKQYIHLHTDDLNRLLLLWQDIGLPDRPSRELYNYCISCYFGTVIHKKKYNWSNLTQLLDTIITHPNYDAN